MRYSSSHFICFVGAVSHDTSFHRTSSRANSHHDSFSFNRMLLHTLSIVHFSLLFFALLLIAVLNFCPTQQLHLQHPHSPSYRCHSCDRFTILALKTATMWWWWTWWALPWKIYSINAPESSHWKQVRTSSEHLSEHASEHLWDMRVSTDIVRIRITAVCCSEDWD